MRIAILPPRGMMQSYLHHGDDMIPILRCRWKVKLGNQDEGKNRSQIPSEKIGYCKFEENMLACTAEGLCSERECGIIYWKTVLPICLSSRLHWIDIRACSTITIRIQEGNCIEQITIDHVRISTRLVLVSRFGAITMR